MLHIPNQQNPLPLCYRTARSIPKVPACEQQQNKRYCSRVAQTATDFADASHSKSAKSAAITVSYGIFSSENAYPCTVTNKLYM